MKKVLGLDLGTNSIGWALVKEVKNNASEIIKLGVRVNPLTVDEKTNFEKGKPLSTNADRTLKRGARRNLQRFKLRRENLREILLKNHLITEETRLAEHGKNTTHETLRLRAKAAREQISLENLARVFFSINKKRGYKSSRKATNEEEGQAIDGMLVAKELYDNDLTPGHYVLNLLEKGKKYIPDFYRSDLQKEFDVIWRFQKQFYPTILDDELYEALQNQGQQNSRKRFLAIKGIYTAENKGKRELVKKQHYTWRAKATSEQLAVEEVAYVLTEINNNLNQSSGYLGAISDRSKELYFKKETVGEYLYKQIQQDKHLSLKNQVFYRQDYLDEFEQIWKIQSKFYAQLTPDLKDEIRDVIIFYQRKLKSQKGLLSFCQFESWQEIYVDKTTGKTKKRTIGRKVIAKSSPLFQEFKIWQNINHLQIIHQNVKDTVFVLDDEHRSLLFEELNWRGNLKEVQVLKLLGLKAKEWKTNFSEGLEGNRTNELLYKVYEKIAENEGYGFGWEKRTSKDVKNGLTILFSEIGINTNILEFNANLEGVDFEKQPLYQLWHLLYATEEDDKINEEDKLVYGNSSVSLKKKLVEKFGFPVAYAKMMASISFQQEYGNLSSKAIRKIYPELEVGKIYSEACSFVGYNHSNSETKEEKESRVLLDKVESVPKNSLRNPVVEKILNQMVNLINQIIDEYGKPDEVRIELARELKKSAKERERMTKRIAEATRRNDHIKKLIANDFNIPNPTKNDVVRYRLWEELETRGYKTLFTDQCISKEKLFSKEVDIEHIIPKAMLFDDSFSNKTLAYREINLKKRDRTAYDFISEDYHSNLQEYIQRVENLYNNGKGVISKAKRNRLLMSQKELPDGFIERDLRNSQYIAKKAKELLSKVFKEVTSTSGSITDRLREDWGLVNVMKELSLPKYKALGLTEFEERLDKGTGKLKKIEVISDWTKRNDHRHHAMDALTVAFTTHNHIQYINHLNARKNEDHKKHGVIANIEKQISQKVAGKNGNKKQQFMVPMLDFRSEAKKHIEAILISFKNKNKVVTRNKNLTKGGGKEYQNTLTPRGQLHKETVYGTSKRLLKKATKLNKRFTLKQMGLMANPDQKEIVRKHLARFDNNPAIAFDAKTLKTHPLIYKDKTLNEVLCFEEIFTIRKEISPDLKIDKVVDAGIRKILNDRLEAFNNNAKEAFSDLDKNPIWLHKEKGIRIKRVTITGVSNAEPLHYKKNHLGIEILNKNGEKQPVDFVSTGNNHHVAIYRDEKGKLQEKVISFYEAVERANQKIPIVDKKYNHEKGWQFLFTLKQNEMFVFPSENFNPLEIDLLDEKNTTIISNYLFRVQKIATKDYFFRHHLETKVESNIALKGKKWRREGLSGIEEIIKVRINHIGKIVQVGEY